jgi:nitrous oxidase accessory protein
LRPVRVAITGNVIVHDAVGVYVDMSPLQLGDTLAIRGNALRMDRTAVVFHASPQRLAVDDNDFADNDVQVRVDGGGDAIGATWSGNYFDDYTGYDLDGDGTGDVAYELRSLSGQLIGQHAELALFRGTPALDLVDAASHLDPQLGSFLVGIFVVGILGLTLWHLIAGRLAAVRQGATTASAAAVAP